ncbi:hypothetical protein B0T10DRAFT_260356 [Thelonectria olida]|uniref:MARVEL domain-containing protein n=1 Tax=Thelonectria olida TaxID=1576542 RepID=A0A9P8VQ90_9HYPO|nr:hypothetical protein B0T10DRAFT_260356 [Thelonectria olida]
MGGAAGLKCLQWLIRGNQLGSATLMLAVYSYFLATLAAHDFDISRHIRAVEGISGSAVLYGLLGVLLICCIGGVPMASFIAIILDTGFLACFIYVAVANKHGAGNCRGEVDTPYGRGLAKSRIKGKRGSLALPTYRVACQLQTACLATAIIAVLFFFFSIILDVALARNHYGTNRRENKGYGYQEQNGFLGGASQQGPWDDVPDHLPTHIHPEDMMGIRSNSISHQMEGISHESSNGDESTCFSDADHHRDSRSHVLEPPYPV